MPNSIATPNALRQSDAGFRLLADTMPQMVWSTLPDGFHDYYNQRWYEFTGMPEGSTDGEAWNGMFHPDDQERAWGKWRHSLATGEPYEVEYRLRHHSGAYRWTIGRALPLRDTERPDRPLDRHLHRHRRRQAPGRTDRDPEPRTQPPHQEHLRGDQRADRPVRAPQTGSGEPSPTILRQRIWALGRAHEFARPHSEESRTGIGESSLMGLLRELLRPYPALDEGRLTIDGDDVPIDDRGATPLALIFHELATNAAKYGALSVADGMVSLVSRREGNDLVIEWKERGGPVIEAEPDRIGFGTKLVDMSVVRQLNGEILRSWDNYGLRVTLRVQPERLVRGD